MLYNYDELSFNVLSVAQLEWKKSHHFVKPRSFSALAFRINGTGLFNAEEKSITTCPGDILFLPKGIGYEVEYSDNKIIVIHFSECNYMSKIENYRFENPTVFYKHFEKILEAWDKENCIYKINSLIYDLLFEMREQEQKKTQFNAFNRCVDYINENFTDQQFSISEMCKKFGISDANLRLKFNREFDMPPKQYLLKLRLNRAIKMLSEHLCTIEEISDACGFYDSKYFAKIIKERYGISPSSLSKKMRI